MPLRQGVSIWETSTRFPSRWKGTFRLLRASVAPGRRIACSLEELPPGQGKANPNTQTRSRTLVHALCKSRIF